MAGVKSLGIEQVEISRKSNVMKIFVGNALSSVVLEYLHNKIIVLVATAYGSKHES